MSRYLDKQAHDAGRYPNIQAIVEAAIANRTTAFGWVSSQFYQAYPGGRTINRTEAVRTYSPAVEWSGSLDPHDPDNYWIDDETGERVSAKTGKRKHLRQG